MSSFSLVLFTFWLKIRPFTGSLPMFLSTMLRQFLLISFHYVCESFCKMWKRRVPAENELPGTTAAQSDQLCQDGREPCVSGRRALCYFLDNSDITLAAPIYRVKLKAACHGRSVMNEYWKRREQRRPLITGVRAAHKGHAEDFFFFVFPKKDCRVLTHPNDKIFNKNL